MSETSEKLIENIKQEDLMYAMLESMPNCLSNVKLLCCEVDHYLVYNTERFNIIPLQGFLYAWANKKLIRGKSYHVLVNVENVRKLEDGFLTFDFVSDININQLKIMVHSIYIAMQDTKDLFCYRRKDGASGVHMSYEEVELILSTPDKVNIMAGETNADPADIQALEPTEAEKREDLGTKLDQIDDPVVLRGIIEDLYQIIDNIDSAVDAFKPSKEIMESPYFKYICKEHEKRWNKLSSDGFSIYLKK